MGRKKKKFDFTNIESVTDVIVAGLSPAFYPKVPYVEEAHKNPRYLFKKVRYSRKKRKELLSRHRDDVEKGKYGVKPWDPSWVDEMVSSIESTSKKLTRWGSLTAKKLSEL